MEADLYHNGKVPKLGLGTDCSGGYSPSMINSMRFAVATSNNVAIAEKNGTFLNYKAKMILLQETYIYCFFPLTKFPIDDRAVVRAWATWAQAHVLKWLIAEKMQKMGYFHCIFLIPLYFPNLAHVL